MRVVFYTFLFLVGFIFSVVIIIPCFFFLNNYKEKIESLVFAKTKNVLVIKGKINLSIFPGVKLKVKNISYKTKKGEELFYSEELSLSPKILPLIRGDLVFNSVKIISPIIFVKNEQGNKSNWEIAFPKKIKNEDINQESIVADNNQIKKKKIKEEKLNPLNIKTLIVKDAKILININNKKNDFEKINFTVNYNNKDKYLVAGDLKYKDDKLSFSYDLSYLIDKANIKGNIKGNSIEVSNTTELFLNAFKGNSIVDIEIKKPSKVFQQYYLLNSPISIYSDLSFTKNSFKLKDTSINIKENKIKLNGSLNKTNNKKDINFIIKSDEINLNDILDFNKVKQSNKTNDDIKNKNETNLETINKKNIIDIIFDQLESYKINSNIIAKQVTFNELKYKDVNFKLIKNKDIDISLKFNNRFLSKLKAKSNIKYNKNASVIASIESLNIDELNKYKKFDKLNGKFSFLINANTKLINKSSMLGKLNGKLEVNTNDIKVNDLNLKSLKTNILNLEKIDDLLNLKQTLFTGSTKIKDQKIVANINNGALKFANTHILVDDYKINLTGDYQLEPNKVNLNMNYESQSNKLLSLFKVNLKGNIYKIKPSLEYDKEIVKNMVGTIVEKKMKKIIKDNLDSKFNNIIENLLD